jgi:hypothetical protein
MTATTYSEAELSALRGAGLELRDGYVCRRGGPRVPANQVVAALEHLATEEPTDLRTLTPEEVAYLRRFGVTVDGQGVARNRDGQEVRAVVDHLIRRYWKELDQSRIYGRPVGP